MLNELVNYVKKKLNLDIEYVFNSTIKGFSGIIHNVDLQIKYGSKKVNVIVINNTTDSEVMRGLALYIDTGIPVIMYCKNCIENHVPDPTNSVTIVRNEKELMSKIKQYLM